MRYSAVGRRPQRIALRRAGRDGDDIAPPEQRARVGIGQRGPPATAGAEGAGRHQAEDAEAASAGQVAGARAAPGVGRQQRIVAVFHAQQVRGLVAQMPGPLARLAVA